MTTSSSHPGFASFPQKLKHLYCSRRRARRWRSSNSGSQGRMGMNGAADPADSQYHLAAFGYRSRRQLWDTSGSLRAHDGAMWTLWKSNMKQELLVSFCCCQRLWHILGTTLVWRVKPTWCPHSYQVGWCENGFSFIFKRLFPGNWGLGCLWPVEEDKQGCKLQGRVTHCLYLNSIITHPLSQSDGTKTL